MNLDVPPFRHQAACSPATAHLFAAEAGGLASRAREREAKAICEGCPVRNACLAWALEHGEAGIWGGTTAEERPRICTSCRARLLPKSRWNSLTPKRRSQLQAEGVSIHYGRGLCSLCYHRARRGTEEAAVIKERPCRRCGRTMVADRAWRAASQAQRAHWRASGLVRASRDDCCATCRRRLSLGGAA